MHMELPPHVDAADVALSSGVCGDTIRLGQSYPPPLLRIANFKYRRGAKTFGYSVEHKQSILPAISDLAPRRETELKGFHVDFALIDLTFGKSFGKIGENATYNYARCSLAQHGGNVKFIMPRSSIFYAICVEENVLCVNRAVSSVSSPCILSHCVPCYSCM